MLDWVIIYSTYLLRPTYLVYIIFPGRNPIKFFGGILENLWFHKIHSDIIWPLGSANECPFRNYSSTLWLTNTWWHRFFNFKVVKGYIVRNTLIIFLFCLGPHSFLSSRHYFVTVMRKLCLLGCRNFLLNDLWSK